ncbi:PQQ-dependent sugar dehydrogenase [Granulicella sp. dw_53]|uniref:PQQ-dependent sugar dehydrogenase n=1 Tax=Granulicella sp. dw_53 TaxID=2719792 RepID=UPI001BD68123|nr:PQQ-dependent sugar dehydrogenase [Granulicella sp. dw_53]
MKLTPTSNVAACSALLAAFSLLPTPLPAQQTITGQAAFAGYGQQKPGVRRKITVADLPEPNPSESVDNGPTLVVRPKGALPIAPAGFKVQLYAGGDAATPMQRSEDKEQIHAPTSGTFVMPRIIRTAPNGDLFVADSQAGSLLVLRGVTPAGKPVSISTYANGLDHPFGIAFYPAGPNPQWIYIGTATTVVRFPYKSGDLKASSNTPETIVPDLPGYAQLRGGGHWTRDVVFTADSKYMLVSVGSGSNADDPDTHPGEFHRADILEYTPQGKFVKVYAYGIRNCVGEAINPITSQLWCSTNERDALGNNLVPDYVTSIKEDGFYGWPWYYMGGHQDPRLKGTHPELKSKVITPDVLVQPHMASLGMTFYPTAKVNFPAQYDGDGFAAEHGSWNRANPGGYEVIRIPMHNGKATGEYEDFLTGFITPDGKIWGRPVGVAVGKDGALYVTDDGSRSVWRVSYTGK